MRSESSPHSFVLDRLCEGVSWACRFWLLSIIPPQHAAQGLKKMDFWLCLKGGSEPLPINCAREADSDRSIPNF
jgi:hypothetical protein